MSDSRQAPRSSTRSPVSRHTGVPAGDSHGRRQRTQIDSLVDLVLASERAVKQGDYGTAQQAEDAIDRIVAYGELLYQERYGTNSNTDSPEHEVEGDNKAPYLPAELAAIQQRADGLAFVAQTVGELGIENADVQVQVAGLHEVATRYEQLARDIGMRAVAENRISQVQLARMLGVAPMTVNRWVKALQQEQQAPADKPGDSEAK